MKSSLWSLLVGLTLLFAASHSLAQAQQTAVTFELKSGDATLKYRYWLYLPKGYEKSDKAWPLLIFLHGAGETGTDLKRVKKHGPPKLADKKNFPFVIISPQTPRRGWNAAHLDALLDDALKQYKVDVSRVYLTGLSMGGFGTWSWAAKSPERFAAIVPICGGGRPDTAKKIKDLPTWVFHGGKDRVVPARYSENMVKALKKVGGNPKITIYPNAGHDSWTETYSNPELYKWLLKQKRDIMQWRGTWASKVSDHNGELYCTVTKLNEKNWTATFTGFCNREFAYRIKMNGKTEGKKVTFRGKADLGEKDGKYTWEGTIIGEIFSGQYVSKKGGRGEFQMRKAK